MSASLEPGLLTLAEAAARLGCHVETLRLRFRRERGQWYGLAITRGPHGRIYVSEEELSYLVPIRRMKRRPPHPERSALIHDWLARLVDSRSLGPWERELVSRLLANPASEPPLYHALSVLVLAAAGFNNPEIADQLRLSERQVRRLRRRGLRDALLAARDRQARAERGALRRAAPALVAAIQDQLAMSGFLPARRHPRSSESGARGGRAARVAVVRDLNRDQVRALLAAGLSREQVSAISLVGIGSDELNHLILHGLPTTGSPGPT